MGDTMRFLDHGLSSVITIDPTDMPALVEQLDQIPNEPYSTFLPANSQYQPRDVPWLRTEGRRLSFSKQSPAGGDWMHVEIYDVDETTVGVWIYSDWN